MPRTVGIGSKIFIVTEGGGNIGYGHLTRCQAIWQAFAERNIFPIVLCDNDDTTIGLDDFTSTILMPWRRNLDLLWRKVHGAKIVIIDSLLAPESIWVEVHNHCRTAVLIDDYVRRNHLQGVVVDWTALAELQFYRQKNAGVIYLLGTRFAALRKPFWDLPRKTNHRNISKVLVTFGGSDVGNVTPRIIHLLRRQYEGFSVIVVVGPGFQNLEEINDEVYKNCKLSVQPDAHEMVRLMRWADLGITATGQTIYEMARIGLPAIGVGVAENTRDDISGWIIAGFLQYAGQPNEESFEEKIVERIKSVSESGVRFRVSSIGRTMVDGQGARRLASSLLESG